MLAFKSLDEYEWWSVLIEPVYRKKSYVSITICSCIYTIIEIIVLSQEWIEEPEENELSQMG